MGETKFELLVYVDGLVVLMENKKVPIEQTQELLETNMEKQQIVRDS